jgi:hypothetical protein
MLSRKVARSIPDDDTDFFNLSNPSSHIIALVLIQLLTKISTRNLPWGVGGVRERPALKTNNLTAICVSIA